MTPLTIDVLRVFFAFVTVAAILTIAIVVIANTADVDSMADPAPRLGEDDPHVPADVMLRIDAALPREQVNARWDFNREGMVQ